MKVLVACEFSGAVRRAFRARGHDAWSCDLLPAEDGAPQHIQGDVRLILEQDWDMMIAHPPCTYLAVSGFHWNYRTPGRMEKTVEAIRFVETLWAARAKRVCVENPVGILSTMSRLGRPAQIVQPHQFGHDASKATCLWLRGLAPLRPTCLVEGRPVMMANGKIVRRWANQTDSGQNRLPPSEHRAMDRSRTYPGLAEAMAARWGENVEVWMQPELELAVSAPAASPQQNA
jgi:hypothetical protein